MSNIPVEITAAIIGLIGAIIAAIIGLRKKKRNKDSELPTVQSGGHSIIATDHAVQNVFMNKQNIPDPQTQKYDEIVDVAEKIKMKANQILEENEEILSPLLNEKPNRMVIGENMNLLFNIQHSRADFGEWKTFLETKASLEKSFETKIVINELVSLVEKLHNTLYSYSSSLDIREGKLDQMAGLTKKYLVTQFLTREDETQLGQDTVLKLRAIANDYLEYLRGLTEAIGGITGRLRALSQHSKTGL